MLTLEKMQSQINSISFHSKGKKSKINPQQVKKKEIIKIRTEINKIQNKNNKISKTKNWFFEKFGKIDSI